jgi:thiol-disulfide isomerase/thioredoxin
VRGVQIALAAAVLTSTLAAQQKVSPSFSALDEGAYAKLITAHKGRVVLVNFWATWCKPCRAEMPDLARLAEKLRGKGLDLVSISTDEPDREGEALKFLAATKVPGPLYIRKAADDDKFNATVDAKWPDGVLPALFLYDRSGKKVEAFLGEKPVPVLEAAIVKLL